MLHSFPAGPSIAANWGDLYRYETENFYNNSDSHQHSRCGRFCPFLFMAGRVPIGAEIRMTEASLSVGRTSPPASWAKAATPPAECEFNHEQSSCVNHRSPPCGEAGGGGRAPGPGG